MKRLPAIGVFTLMTAFTLATLAFAGVPQTISYQGYLKNGDGTPVTSSTSIRFSLYSSNPARNNPVWRETKSVTPTNGVYSTQLGSVTPIAAPFDVPYSLGVKVGSDAEMALQPLASVPYALKSRESEALTTAAMDQLDSRYRSTVQPLPSDDQLVNLRWDLVRSGSATIAGFDQPVNVAFDGTNIWVLNQGSSYFVGNVMKLNWLTGQVMNTLQINGARHALFDGKSLWIQTNYQLIKLNPVTDAVEQSFSIGNNLYAIAYDGRYIWLSKRGTYGNDQDMNFYAFKIDPATGAQVGPSVVVGVAPYSMIFDGTYIWVANYESSSVTRINASTGAASSPLTVQGIPSGLAFDGHYVWVGNVVNGGGGTLQKIDPASNTVVSTITTGSAIQRVMFDGVYIWTANSAHTVSKYDPSTGTLKATISTGACPLSLAFDGLSVWVANFCDNTVTRFANAGLIVGAQTVENQSIVDGAVTSAKLAPPFSFSHTSTSVPTLAATSAGFIGMRGSSDSNVGVEGDSTSSVGVKGYSAQNTGIWGVAVGGTAIDGLSTSGTGVIGRTTSGVGVQGSTGDNIALYGINTSTAVPAVEGWNKGSGDIFRGWSGASPALKFSVANNGTTWSLNGYTQGSDLRLKTDIQPLESSLSKVMNLRGVSYVMKADEKKERKIGVIAQELEKEYPELVATDDQGMKSVAYANLTAILIEAVKSLQAESDSLKKRLELIERQISVK